MSGPQPLFYDDFSQGLGPGWCTMLQGEGSIALAGSHLRLSLAGASVQVYANAQIDDYQGRDRRALRWRPPLRLTVRARFSHPATPAVSPPPAAPVPACLQGTAGFGFWNDPFLTPGRRLPALPQVLWFFYSSPPSNMKLALEVPGWGWKAATLDGARPAVRLLLPAAPLGALLMRSPTLYRWLWPQVQRWLGIGEAAIAADMRDWHTYRLDWEADRARFWVDGRLQFSSASAPPGPLGLVIWIDNQFLVLTPQGHYRHGRVAVPVRQWLELDWVVIEPLPAAG